MSGITICADDFGYHEAVSNGILKLLENRKINATSCMTNMPDWPRAAEMLSMMPPAQIGLHLNLTDGVPLTDLPCSHFGSLNKLLMLSHLRLLDKNRLIKEFDAQLKAFKDGMNRMPDFIDGHQHIHQFPVIREAVLAIHKKHLTKNTGIRVSSNPLSQVVFKPKSLILALTGALSLKKILQKNGIAHNQHFSGIYNFDSTIDYARKFSSFLEEIQGDGLIMCHPASPDYTSTSDPIAKARLNEFNYLMARETL